MIGVAGQKRVPDDCLRDLAVPVNDLASQKTIADYLDAETARIDALIGSNSSPGPGVLGRMTGLLAERRHAVISAGVEGDVEVKVVNTSS